MRLISLFPICIVFLFVSCSIKSYDKKITLNRNSVEQNKIFFNGLYYYKPPLGKHAPEYMFLYSDGTLIIGSWRLPEGNTFWNNPEEQLKKIPKNLDWSISTGTYYLQNDTLSIMVYQRTYQGFYKYKLEEFKAIVNNDSTIYFFENKCKWCHKFYGNYEKVVGGKYASNSILKFHPSEFKPDSSFVWFKNERWYKEFYN